MCSRRSVWQAEGHVMMMMLMCLSLTRQHNITSDPELGSVRRAINAA